MLGPFATASLRAAARRIAIHQVSPPAHRCSQQQRRRRRRQRLTEGTAMAPWNGPNYQAETISLDWMYFEASKSLLLDIIEGRIKERRRVQTAEVTYVGNRWLCTWHSSEKLTTDGDGVIEHCVKNLL